MAREYEVAAKPDIEFAEHDGAKLLGDLYLPQGLDKAPALVAAHGGAGRSAIANSIATGATISPNMATRFSQ